MGKSKKVYRYSWCCFLLLFASISGITAQVTVEKTLTLSYSMQPSGTFVLDNRYGKVEIEGWDQDRLEAIMSVKVKHKSEEKAYNLLDRIEPVTLEGQNFVNITSTIRDKRTSFFNDLLKNIDININKSDVDIDYIIKVPQSVKLDIKNSFGDILIENCSGHLLIDLNHGGLWLNSLMASANIHLKYAKMNANQMPDTQLSMKGSEAYIGNGTSVLLESSGSELEIKEVRDLQINGTRDKLDIEKINSLNGTLKFTTLDIGSLAEDLNITMHLGDLILENINPSDAKLRINQKSSNIDINIAKAQFVLEATMKGGELRLPEGTEDISQEYIDEEKNHRKIRTAIGRDPSGTIIIRGEKGIVVLREF